MSKLLLTVSGVVVWLFWILTAIAFLIGTDPILERLWAFASLSIAWAASVLLWEIWR